MGPGLLELGQPVDGWDHGSEVLGLMSPYWWAGPIPLLELGDCAVWFRTVSNVPDQSAFDADGNLIISTRNGSDSCPSLQSFRLQSPNSLILRGSFFFFLLRGIL